MYMSDQGVFFSKWSPKWRIILAQEEFFFFNYAYFDILPIRKYWESVSTWLLDRKLLENFVKMSNQKNY